MRIFGSRSSSPSPFQPRPGGHPAASQLPASGLVGWLEQTRVVLPLKGVELRFEVLGEVVGVELDQIYHQDRACPLDVTYAFPLPSGAAVHRCEMHVNGRVVAARVMPLEEAIAAAAKHKALGHRTALVEGVRENLFELELGNLAPGDTVVIRLAYVQNVERVSADLATFRIPLTPGIRYIPGRPLLRQNRGKGASDDTDAVPDASRISPPRIDVLHPDAAYLSCEGLVDAQGWDPAQLTSPSHALLVECHPERKGVASVRLASKAEVPDRDLAVRLVMARGAEVTSAGWSSVEGGHQYAAARLVAPPLRPPTAPRDFYFLIDRSGSMEGVKWVACCQAVREFLQQLSALDRAWVTFFESEFRDLAETPMPAAAILAEPVIAGLEQLPTGGGTELFPALAHVLEALDRHAAPAREPCLVILTDGQVGDEERIGHLLEPRQGRLRVHTLGIDTAVNDAFLKQLAADHGGACSLATPGDDIPGMVAALARKTGTAVARNLRVEGAWETPGQGLPALWEGDAVTLALRAPAAEPPQVVVRGEMANGETLSWTIPLERAANPALRLLWQRRRLQWLEREGRRQDAIHLACEANLLCKGAAFVAWDEAERIARAGRTLVFNQPSLAPADWIGVSHFGCFPDGWADRIARCAPPVSHLVRERLDAEEPEPPLIPAVRADAGWRARLPSLLGLPPATAVQLIGWLEQWIWMTRDQSQARQEALEQFVTECATAATGAGMRQEALTAAFVDWVNRTIDSAPIRESLVSLLVVP